VICLRAGSNASNSQPHLLPSVHGTTSPPLQQIGRWRLTAAIVSGVSVTRPCTTPPQCPARHTQAVAGCAIRARGQLGRADMGRTDRALLLAQRGDDPSTAGTNCSTGGALSKHAPLEMLTRAGDDTDVESVCRPAGTPTTEPAPRRSEAYTQQYRSGVSLAPASAPAFEDPPDTGARGQ